jgi:hypothetical protein
VMPTSPDPGAAMADADAAAPDLAMLDTLPERPLHEHAAVYEALHGQLQAALNQIDEA